MIPRGLRRGPSWCMLTPHCRRYNVSFLWMLRRICIELELTRAGSSCVTRTADFLTI
jgi:hypothetical protein